LPEKHYIDKYIESKAKRNEIIDYDTINSILIKCEFCKKLFHPQGIYKHKIYCPANPNRKKTYGNKRKWKCRFCSLLFKHNKERNLHESRCAKNQNAIIIHSRMSNQDKLNLFKSEFPEIYEILKPEQIKEFLDGDHDNR